MNQIIRRITFLEGGLWKGIRTASTSQDLSKLVRPYGWASCSWKHWTSIDCHGFHIRQVLSAAGSSPLRRDGSEAQARKDVSLLKWLHINAVLEHWKLPTAEPAKSKMFLRSTIFSLGSKSFICALDISGHALNPGEQKEARPIRPVSFKWLLVQVDLVS